MQGSFCQFHTFKFLTMLSAESGMQEHCIFGNFVSLGVGSFVCSLPLLLNKGAQLLRQLSVKVRWHEVRQYICFCLHARYVVSAMGLARLLAANFYWRHHIFFIHTFTMLVVYFFFQALKGNLQSLFWLSHPTLYKINGLIMIA